jgi:hypothetical protein
MGSVQEAHLRRLQHEQYLLPLLENYRLSRGLDSIRLLDYGGGEGGIQPKASWISTNIIEVSSDNEAKDQKRTHDDCYDIVQCLHVLEHVGNPLKTCQDILSHCKDGGLVYLEVPIEFPGLDAIAEDKLPMCHEHINKLCKQSIKSMLEACDVDIIEVKEDFIDFLHLDGLTPVVRAMAQFNPQK